MGGACAEGLLTQKVSEPGLRLLRAHLTLTEPALKNTSLLDGCAENLVTSLESPQKQIPVPTELWILTLIFFGRH